MATLVANAIGFHELAARLRHSPATRQLVILDFNGLLVHRVKSADRRGIKAATDFRNPWRRFQRRSVWLRPHLRRFLLGLFQHYDVALWTSAERQNVEPLLDAISTSLSFPFVLSQSFGFIWTRDQCRADPQTGPYASVKYLQDVWSHPEFESKYSPGDTFLIDDSWEKVRHFPESAILIPEYSPQTLGSTFNNDDTLLWLLMYIEYVAEERRKGKFPMSLTNFAAQGRELVCRELNGKDRRRLKSHALHFLGKESYVSSPNTLMTTT